MILQKLYRRRLHFILLLLAFPTDIRVITYIRYPYIFTASVIPTFTEITSHPVIILLVSQNWTIMHHFSKASLSSLSTTRMGEVTSLLPEENNSLPKHPDLYLVASFSRLRLEDSAIRN